MQTSITAEGAVIVKIARIRFADTPNEHTRQQRLTIGNTFHSLFTHNSCYDSRANKWCLILVSILCHKKCLFYGFVYTDTAFTSVLYLFLSKRLLKVMPFIALNIARYNSPNLASNRVQ
jgi:hypothetical protein